MRLPGGVIRGGERRRDFAFRPADGALEAALAEAAASATVPAAVTAALTAALAELGGEPVDAPAVWDLSVGDRQFLVRQLAAHLGRDRVWLTAACATCGESFDVEVRQSDLPVKEAGEGYPFAQTDTLRLRVPTGADQQVVAELSHDEAVRVLFTRCRIDGDGDLDAADRALEAVAPEVAMAAVTGCPACGATNEVAVDPYLGVEGGTREVFEDVHRLASEYHWSEAEILALSRSRRLMYLALIDRTRGFTR